MFSYFALNEILFIAFFFFNFPDNEELQLLYPHNYFAKILFTKIVLYLIISHMRKIFTTFFKAIRYYHVSNLRKCFKNYCYSHVSLTILCHVFKMLNACTFWYFSFHVFFFTTLMLQRFPTSHRKTLSCGLLFVK